MTEVRDSSDRVVVVAVATYRRPEQLAVLLAALPSRIAELAPDEVAGVRVLVVDNDPAGSAETVARSAGGLDLTYLVESTPGVSAARNTALRHAGERSLLVFVDDDETPRPGWLPALVRTWRDAGADAVVGPVVSVFEVDPDPWVVASGAHDREHRRGLTTGTQVSRAATNNLLLDVVRVRELGVEFDPRFGLTGGEDSMFTGTLVGRGGRIVWCAEATVEDRVPADRLTRDYLVDRTESLANAAARVELELGPGGASSWRSRLRLAGVAVARTGLGTALAVSGLVRRDLRARARGAVHRARARGELRAALGRTVSPYARG